MTAVAIAFTATASTDQLAATAHGLNTGDGPVAVRGLSGAAPLAPVTNYFAIKIDANTVKLATSAANALAGTAIDITSNGSGTLEYGIPFRRRTTYAAGSQVKSLDLDEIQDALVGVHDVFTGQSQALWAGVTLAIPLTLNQGATLAANQSMQVSGTGGYKRGTRVRHLAGSAGILISTPAASTQYYNGDQFRFRSVSDVAKYSLILDEGEQLQSVSAYVSCGASDVLTMKLWKTVQTVGGAVASEVQLGTTKTSAGHSNLIEALTVGSLTENLGNGIVCYSVDLQATNVTTFPLCVAVDYITIVP